MIQRKSGGHIMKNRKKALIAGLACAAVLGITIPAAAFSMQNQEAPLKKEQVEQKAEVRQSGAEDMLKQAVQTINEKGEEVTEPEDVILPTVAPADVTENLDAGTTAAVCPYYVDANGDGYCDHCAHNGACGNYTDANGDGICDYCTHNGSGHCGNYVDTNGDGICDNWNGNGGNGNGGGHHGDGHHGGHHW